MFISFLYLNCRQQLITAHEDQLAEITNMCKHEMKLLMSVKMGDQVNFLTYFILLTIIVECC